MYLLDTNPIIYFVQKEPRATALLGPIFSADVPLFVATISITEFFSPRLMPSEERIGVEGILAVLTSIPLDVALARYAGDLRSKHGLKLADSVIAASALITNSTLLTRNVRDFKRVPGLSVERI